MAADGAEERFPKLHVTQRLAIDHHPDHRVRRAINERVNEIVIEHDYPNFQTFQAERAAFHADRGGVGEVPAVLAEPAVPGTAVQSDLDGFEFPSATAS
jgi:hypothetical protein